MGHALAGAKFRSGLGEPLGGLRRVGHSDVVFILPVILLFVSFMIQSARSFWIWNNCIYFLRFTYIFMLYYRERWRGMCGR